MRKNTTNLIIFFFLLLLKYSNSNCSKIILPDGNYYVLSTHWLTVGLCVDDCIEQNKALNQTEEQMGVLAECCTPICGREVDFYNTQKIAIIVVSAFLGFFMLVCCLFGCFGPTIQQTWVLYKEQKNRPPYTQNMTPQQFDEFATNFKNIFTKKSLPNWHIIFTQPNQKPEQMHCQKFSIKKQSNYLYQLSMIGTDILGKWIINGYFINTEQGPSCWGLKNYTIANNHPHVFDYLNDLIFQLFLSENGDYCGKLYSRSDSEKSGNCWIKKLVKDQKSISDRHSDDSQEIISVKTEQII